MQTTRLAGPKSSLLLNRFYAGFNTGKYSLNHFPNKPFHTTSLELSDEKRDKPEKTSADSGETLSASATKENDTCDTTVRASLLEPDKVNNKKAPRAPPPEAPSNCCRSNCANCVWIQYALEMTEYYRDGGSEAMKFLDDVDDPALKAFLKMELKSKLQED